MLQHRAITKSDFTILHMADVVQMLSNYCNSGEEGLNLEGHLDTELIEAKKQIKSDERLIIRHHVLAGLSAVEFVN